MSPRRSGYEQKTEKESCTGVQGEESKKFMIYPRILLLHMTKVHSDDPSNLLVRTLFGGWPKSKIAQIYTGNYSGAGEFCGEYHAIGSRERMFGRMFGLLKPLGVNSIYGHSVEGKGIKSNTSFIKVLSKQFVSRIIDSGIWEAVFRIRLSPSLANFIYDFSPDAIYTQGYNLGITRLALQISDVFSVPICYFPVDDWHCSLYSGSPMHIEVDRLAKTITKRAALRFALGPKMTEVLTTRYGVDFECIYNADDLARFKIVDRKQVDDNPIIIGYSGSLYLGRTACLLDLLRSCKLLKHKLKIRIYCKSLPVDTPNELVNSENVEFLPLPSHDDLPKYLIECDILFLPESFDPAHKKAIELSLSTKCHLYMMSGRPILVYGPDWSGTVDYARRFGWGIVVDKRDEKVLLQGISKALSKENAKEIVEKGYSVAKMNHDVEALRKRVLERINSTVQGDS